MQSLAQEWFQGRGSDPEIIVYAIGNWLRPSGFSNIDALLNDPGSDQTYFADLARPNNFVGGQPMRCARPLRSYLHDAVIFLGRLHHAPAFQNIVRDRLLHI